MSTVACTDSVESSTAPTRSISVAAWSTTRWASATNGTVWWRNCSEILARVRVSRRSAAMATSRTMTAPTQAMLATRTAISPADMILRA